MSSPFTRAVSMLCFALSACGAARENGNEPAAQCQLGNVRSSSQALINGDSQANYLGLSKAQRGALGRLQEAGSQSTCTGVRIAEGWVLTARHCTILERAQFHANDGEQRTVVEWIPHPELDLALARLNTTTCSSTQVLPIAEPDESTEKLRRATLAGYGLTERNQLGELAFLVESVVAIDEGTVTVDGFGKSGACVGDSGGPLLVRDHRGQVAVLGVLSRGASTCVGSDVYVRVDRVDAWLRDHVELPPASEDCGEIDARGRCFEQQAVWCSEGRLASDACSADSACGFQELEAGFRCASSPSCVGDAFGSCDDGSAKRCAGADSDVESCGSLGLSCGYDPKSGVAICR